MKLFAKTDHRELVTAGDWTQRASAQRMEDAIYFVSRGAGYASLLVAVALLIGLMV